MNQPEPDHQPGTDPDPVREELMRPLQLQRHVPGERRDEATRAKGLVDPTRIDNPAVNLGTRIKDEIRLVHVACMMGNYAEAETHLEAGANLNQELYALLIKMDRDDLKGHVNKMGEYLRLCKNQITAAKDAGLSAIELVTSKDGRKFVTIEPVDPTTDDS